MPAYPTSSDFSNNPDAVDAVQIYTGAKPEPSCDATTATAPETATSPASATAADPDPVPASPPSSKIDACMATCNDACNADSSYFVKK